MYIKIINPQQDGNKIYNNTGSVDQLVEYLRHEERENEKEDIPKEIFFNHTRDRISAEEVKEKINNNVKGVKVNEEKFYSIIVNPSEDEIVHIKNNDDLLRKYVRQVMENYAQNFKLKNGRKLASTDLVWYANIHNDREVKNIDLQNSELLSQKEQQRIKILQDSGNAYHELEIDHLIKRAEARERKKLDREVFRVGDKKPGLNKHVHIIVSRRDNQQNITLNPRTKQERFHIKGFQEKSARNFQSMFQYEKETLREGFYKKYNEKDQQYFDRKIEAATEQMNKHLGEEKIDADRMKKIGQDCQYSKAYFINLTKLKYKFMEGNFVHDPYFFAMRGREQKENEYLNNLDRQYFTHAGQARKGDTFQRMPSQEKTAVSAAQLLSVLGSAGRGPLMIKDTLLLDEERKKLRKFKERGRGGDNIEMG